MEQQILLVLILLIVIVLICIGCVVCSKFCDKPAAYEDIGDPYPAYSVPNNQPIQPIQPIPSVQRPPPVSGHIITINADLANECAICLENFNAGESSRVLDCGHYYHEKCVDPWLKTGKKCPKCYGENMV